ncbi:MAG TPA: hypothetical protein VGC74_09210, partial [Stenotrophomonas sp.]
MTRKIGYRIGGFACAAMVVIAYAAFSAPIRNGSASALSMNGGSSTVVPEAGESLPVQPGEYATNKGWGHLLVKEQAGELRFWLDSIVGENVCALDGTLHGGRGVVKDNNDGSPCIVKLGGTPDAIEVTAETPAECSGFCGYNAGFEGSYARVKDGCSRDELDLTRSAFQRLYDEKDYREALKVLSPIAANCLPVLQWQEEGAVRNDLAITQYWNGLYSQC